MQSQTQTVTSTIHEFPQIYRISMDETSENEPSEPSWESVCQKALNDLTGILNEYDQKRKYNGEWKDPVSAELFVWGANLILEIDLNDEEKTEKELLAFAIERINYVMKEILINPLFEEKGTLKNPVLDGDQIWEDETLEDCKLCCPVSPWNNQPFFVDKKIHEFALEIIAWVNKLPTGTYKPVNTDQQLSSQSSSNDSNKYPPELKMFKMLMYVERAKSARLNKLMKEKFIKPMQGQESVIAKMWEEARQLVEEEIKLAKQNLDDHKVSMDKKLEETEKANDERFTILKNVVEEEKKQREVVTEILKKQDQKCDEQEQKIEQLKETVSSQETRFTNEKVELQNTVNQTVNNLKEEFKTELNEKSKESDKTLSLLKTEHEQKVQRLETTFTNKLNTVDKKLNQEKAKTTKLSKNLTDISKKNAANEQTIQLLRKQLVARATELQHLAKKANKKKKIFGIF